MKQLYKDIMIMIVIINVIDIINIYCNWVLTLWQ
jgi:hypothetical protein